MQHARGEGKVHAVFWWETLKERDHLEDLNVDGKISKYIFKNYNRWGGGLDWIDLAQDWDTRRGFVNRVINLWVP
jgi:hypothetical protein